MKDLYEMAAAGVGGGETASAVNATPAPTRGPNKPRRSTARGEARAKIISALTKHHQYAEGDALNTAPISVRGLAREAGVEPSTVSAFFADKFNGHDQYQALCRRDRAGLVAALKLLNDEFSPHELYGRRPPGEGGGDDDGE